MATEQGHSQNQSPSIQQEWNHKTGTYCAKGSIAESSNQSLYYIFIVDKHKRIKTIIDCVLIILKKNQNILQMWLDNDPNAPGLFIL